MSKTSTFPTIKVTFDKLTLKMMIVLLEELKKVKSFFLTVGLNVHCALYAQMFSDFPKNLFSWSFIFFHDLSML